MAPSPPGSTFRTTSPWSASTTFPAPPHAGSPRFGSRSWRRAARPGACCSRRSRAARPQMSCCRPSWSSGTRRPTLRLSERPSGHDDRPAAARVARADDLAGGGVAAHGLGAAEEHVEAVEARDLPPLGTALCAGLGVDDALLPVHARRLDRVAQVEPAVDHAEDHLEDCRPDAVGAGGAEREHHLAVALDDG